MYFILILLIFLLLVCLHFTASIPSFRYFSQNFMLFLIVSSRCGGAGVSHAYILQQNLFYIPLFVHTIISGMNMCQFVLTHKYAGNEHPPFFVIDRVQVPVCAANQLNLPWRL